MASFTTNFNLTKPDFAEFPDAWHTPINANWDTIDAQIFARILSTEKGAANGVATLNAFQKVVQNPASATATPTASSIPISDGSGKIDTGWLKTGSGNGFDADTVDGEHASAFEHLANKAVANGYASLDSSTKVVQDPANAVTTPAANKIPKASGTGKIDNGWLNTGSGNGLDADTVDGEHASAFEHLANKGAASGYASLDAFQKVVQDPANATSTPTALKIPISDAFAKLDGWISQASTTTSGKVQLATDAESAAGKAVQANDSRLSNARTPTGAAGGSLSGTYPNPSIANSGVTPGTYGDSNNVPQLTIGADGRVTAATTQPNSGAGHQIQDESVALAQRAAIDFQGKGVDASDDSANNKTLVDIPDANVATNDGEPVLTEDAGEVTWTEDYWTWREERFLATLVQTTHSLLFIPQQVLGIFLYIDGLAQSQGVDYTVSGESNQVITFTPALGLDEEVLIKYQGY